MAAVPLILITIFRVKPLYVFVSVITGYFWSEFLGESAGLIVGSMVRNENADFVTQIGLLLLPVVLTLLIMKKTLSTNALPFQFFLLVANSVLLITFLLPLLPPGQQGAIYQTNAGNSLRQSHDVLIAGIVGMHVLFMWIMRPQQPHAKKKH